MSHLYDFTTRRKREVSIKECGAGVRPRCSLGREGRGKVPGHTKPFQMCHLHVSDHQSRFLSLWFVYFQHDAKQATHFLSSHWHLPAMEERWFCKRLVLDPHRGALVLVQSQQAGCS